MLTSPEAAVEELVGSKVVGAAAPRIEGEALLGCWAAVKAAAPRIEGECTSL